MELELIWTEASRIMIQKHSAPSAVILILRYLVEFVCVIGFIYQIIHITDQYARYTTTSRFSRRVPDLMPPPNIAVCLRYADLLNYSLIQTTDSEEEYAATVSDIMTYSPTPEQMVTGCSYRKPNSELYFKATGVDCLNIFTISKFYLEEFICYKIEQKDQELLSFQSISQTLSHSGAIYDMVFNRSIMKSERMKIIVFYGSYPFFSKRLANTFDVMFQDNSTNMDHNTFTASFSFFDVLLLPPPYDTGCNSSLDEGLDQCYLKCMDVALQPVKRTPFSVILLKPVPKIHFNADDFRYPDRMILFDQKDKECRAPCSNNYCYVNYSVTEIEVERGNPNELRIQAVIATQPTVIIQTDPKLNFLEYLIYATSCLGTWFGLAVTDCDLFNDNFEKFRQYFSKLHSKYSGQKKVDSDWKLIRSDQSLKFRFQKSERKCKRLHDD